MFEIFIRRPILSGVISVVIVFLGLLAITSLPITQFPDIVPPSVTVTARYTGANADVMAKTVATPLERAINGVPGMTYMTTVCTNDGMSLTTIYFKVGTDPDVASVNVQNRVTTVLDELPEEVIRAGVITEKEVNSMLMYLNIMSTDSSHTEKFVYNFADINILRELKRIDGVGFVEIMGSRDYAMRVWLNPNRLAAYNMSPQEVTAAIRSQNIEAAPGKTGISSDKIPQQLQYVLQYSGKFSTPEEYGEIVLKALPDGSVLRLKDVATIEFDSEDYNMISMTDGKPSASIMIKQRPGSNAREVIQNIKAKMEEIKESSFAPGMDYNISYDVSRFLDASISVVLRTLLEAFLLVFIVVYLFLQDFRSTLIPAIAVPVSLVGTFFFMQMLGFSINMLTLFALVLAIGIVVDNAIVVVEAVHVKMHNEKLPPAKATEAAIREIGGAIIAITLVMSAVFVPVGFMSGTVGIFYRQFSLTWNLTKSINLSLQTMTNAHIEEPVGVVNKQLFPDEYEAWKDTVLTSIKNLGTPWNYNQTFNASYTAPFSKIPVLDYLSFNAKYNATYTWDRGAQISEEIDLGNSVNNQGQLSFDGRFNFEQLYNKSKYLQKINKRFSSNNRAAATAKKNRKFERTILLREDTTVTLRHNLNNKKVKVVARDDAGKKVALRTKVLDANNVVILDKGTQRLNVIITPSNKNERNFWKEAAEYSLRGLMMVRNASVRYRKTNTTSLPLFSPNVGDIFGQSTSYGPMAPGLDFAFGFTDENYVYRAKERGWLLCDSTQISPAVIGRTEEFNFEIALEPIRGLKINLTGNRTDTRSSQMQFMFDDMPTVRGGSYTKTHIALKTAFRSSSAKDGYSSQAFDDFLKNREIIAARLEAHYGSLGNYPNKGFIASTGFGDKPYDSANGGVNRSSADVMIPAFIAAYSGRDARKIDLSPFPGLSAILPNWRITYDGFMQIPFIKKHFKAFTLSHAYQCTYAVGSFTSFLNWVESDGDFGFVRDELTGNPIPSSPFDISSVMITERFAPLIGLKVTLKNNVTGNIEYKDSRTLTLNSAAGQIVEASTTDFTIGAGYKIANFNTILKLKGSQTGVSNDLTINADFSFRKNQALIRRIEQNFTQATSGTRTTMLKVTANYVLSKRITVGAYFDHQINTPLVSSSSYPITNSNYGISVRLSLLK